MLTFSMVFSVPALADNSSGSCGDNLTWMLDNSGVLTISGTGEMETYGRNLHTEYIYPPWHSVRDAIRSVVIHEGVTSIGRCAFNASPSLKEISIPSSVSVIGPSAFMDCSSLESASIPEGVTRIEQSAFVNCSSLSFVSIPSTVNYIGNFAFENCNRLQTICFVHPHSKGLEIHDSAFNASSQVNTVIKVRDTNSIPYDIESYKWKKANRSVTYETLESFSHPNQDGVASGSCGLDAVWVLGKDGVLVVSGTGSIDDSPWMNIRDSITAVVIENGITSIGSGAFKWLSNVNSIAIAGSVKTIGSEAFTECKMLRELTLSEGIESIGKKAFESSGSLTALVLPSSITSIEEQAFEKCRIQTIQFNHNAEEPLSIGNRVFYREHYGSDDIASRTVLVQDPNNINPAITGLDWGRCGINPKYAAIASTVAEDAPVPAIPAVQENMADGNPVIQAEKPEAEGSQSLSIHSAEESPAAKPGAKKTSPLLIVVLVVLAVMILGGALFFRQYRIVLPLSFPLVIKKRKKHKRKRVQSVRQQKRRGCRFS